MQTLTRKLTPNGIEKRQVKMMKQKGVSSLPELYQMAVELGVKMLPCQMSMDVVAACENCRLQLGDLSGYYGLGIGVTALADLVVKAMRLPGDKMTMEHFMTAEAIEKADKSTEKG